MANSAYRADVASILLLLLSVVALFDAVFDYFWTGNGIHGTGGALLVVASTFLLALATGVVINRLGPVWLRIVFQVLILLDFVGTAAAAYLLEAWILLALISLAALFWIVQLFRRPRSSLALQG